MSYSALQVAAIWEQAGGTPAHSALMAAVAMAESGGDPNAISPSSDYGLWQINDSNFNGHTGLDWSNWSDPIANARAAIAMSGNGSNVAAWCTCWQDPRRDCGHGYLATPQIGTPAYNWLVRIAQDTGTPIPGTPEQAVNAGTSLDGVWGEIQDTINNVFPRQYQQLANNNGLLGGM